jgi:hypothetical protein
LIRENALLGLGQPDARPLQVFKDWFNRKNPFVGFEKDMLDDREDLVTVKNGDDSDRLSRLLRSHLSFLFQVRSLPVCVSAIRAHSEIGIAWNPRLVGQTILLPRTDCREGYCRYQCRALSMRAGGIHSRLVF